MDQIIQHYKDILCVQFYNPLGYDKGGFASIGGKCNIVNLKVLFILSKTNIGKIYIHIYKCVLIQSVTFYKNVHKRIKLKKSIYPIGLVKVRTSRRVIMNNLCKKI